MRPCYTRNVLGDKVLAWRASAGHKAPDPVWEALALSSNARVAQAVAVGFRVPGTHSIGGG